MLSALALQQQSAAHTARHVALDLLFGHPADECRRLASVYQALTPAAVRDVAARVFEVPPAVALVLPVGGESD